MQNKEVDKKLVDDLTFYYEEKKRLTSKDYRHIPTEASNAHFREAAALCEEFELDPATYVQIMYDRMGGIKKFFSPEHLQGTKARFFISDKQDNGGLKIELTNHNLPISEMWRHQHEMAMVYVSRNEPVESVLMDSSLKFFAWFRILATPNRVPEIVDKYKRIAKKEMTSAILAFAKEQNLDLDRLL
jgi:hypothetical protein